MVVLLIFQRYFSSMTSKSTESVFIFFCGFDFFIFPFANYDFLRNSFALRVCARQTAEHECEHWAWPIQHISCWKRNKHFSFYELSFNFTQTNEMIFVFIRASVRDRLTKIIIILFSVHIWNNKTAYDTPTLFIVFTFQRIFHNCIFNLLCFDGDENEYFVKRLSVARSSIHLLTTICYEPRAFNGILQQSALKKKTPKEQQISFRRHLRAT